MNVIKVWELLTLCFAVATFLWTGLDLLKIWDDQSIGHKEQLIHLPFNAAKSCGHMSVVNTMRIKKWRLGMCVPDSIVQDGIQIYFWEGVYYLTIIAEKDLTVILVTQSN